MIAPALDGWIPTGIAWDGARPMVDWRRIDGIRFTDPFLDITLERAMRHPFRLLFGRRTPAEVLEQRAITHPGIPPTGFIFHMSRCGSTLISQMLAACPANVVVSEGWPLDSAINADAIRPAVTADDRLRWTKAMIHALGQPRAGSERRYFVKFDARHMLDFALTRRAFRDVPWVFVYRDPVEVMASHLAEPAVWTAPGIVPARGVSWRPGAGTHAEYTALLLAAVCNAALEAFAAGGGILLNYSKLPTAVYSSLAAHFRCDWSPDEIEIMRAASMRNAKRPGEPFTPDGARKREEAGPRIHEICDRILGDTYRRLQLVARASARRVSQSGHDSRGDAG